ncbi:hypothetical protein, partial [Salmonella enterica]|uniref:hypothetical protein n=1 Tax=Salmonella enterica TaxID=28901 RepID=UPI003CFAB3B8
AAGFSWCRDHSEAAILDSIGDEGVAENLLNAHVHCAFALSFMGLEHAARERRSGPRHGALRCNRDVGL